MGGQVGQKMAQKIEYRLLMGPKHEVISNNCNWPDKKSKMLETLVLLDIENGKPKERSI